jgi:hypothetical protein
MRRLRGIRIGEVGEVRWLLSDRRTQRRRGREEVEGKVYCIYRYHLFVCESRQAEKVYWSGSEMSSCECSPVEAS